MNIKIIHYKAGNIASVINALERLGVTASLAATPEAVAGADKLIFPGVGHAKPAMAVLKQSGLDEAIQSFKGPVLGICLGMQLMATHSEEGPMEGLGIFDEKIVKFTQPPKNPHMGWNRLHNLKGPLFYGIPEGSYAYFVHSYFMAEHANSIAQCTHHHIFTAAVAKDNFFGVQFHPEKSGSTGEQILKNFIQL